MVAKYFLTAVKLWSICRNVGLFGFERKPSNDWHTAGRILKRQSSSSRAGGMETFKLLNHAKFRFRFVILVAAFEEMIPIVQGVQGGREVALPDGFMGALLGYRRVCRSALNYSRPIYFTGKVNSE